MSEHIHPAPQAPQPAATPAQASTMAGASHANFSRPATTQSVTGAAPPATGTTPTAFPPVTAHPPATEEPQTLNTRLNDADRYWKFKSVLQTVAIIIGIIGVGTVGWCMSTSPQYGFDYGYDSSWSLWPSLLTFSCSVIWCFACIAVLVFRKRPVHPGLRVAIDLILWLSFIITVLFAMVSLMELTSWGEGGDLGYGYGYYSSYGNYELVSNGTWVWHTDSSDSDYSDYSDYTRDCDRSTSPGSRSNGFNTFANCVEQDAYINQLWQEKSHRESVELTAVVCQFIGLVLHLALFIWACVDCHHHNRSKVGKDAEKLAASIVQTMIQNGAVIPPPGQTYTRPVAPWGAQPVGYYQLPPQQQQQQAYPLANMYPQRMPAGPSAPQGSAGGVVAGPSSEKSEGPRYA